MSCTFHQSLRAKERRAWDAALMGEALSTLIAGQRRVMNCQFERRQLCEELKFLNQARTIPNAVEAHERAETIILRYCRRPTTTRAFGAHVFVKVTLRQPADASGKVLATATGVVDSTAPSEGTLADVRVRRSVKHHPELQQLPLDVAGQILQSQDDHSKVVPPLLNREISRR